MKQYYGMEAIVDASGCDITRMNRRDLNAFIEELCVRIDMNPALETFFWDEENGGSTPEPHLKGTSAFRFIETSNIVIHTLTMLRSVFLNVFSCKDFDVEVLKAFVQEYFNARAVSATVVKRQYEDPSNFRSDR